VARGNSLFQPNDFEFVDCSTINISYDAYGIATISFTVLSSKPTLDNVYNSIDTGGVLFEGYVTNRRVRPRRNSIGYEHALTLVAMSHR